MGLCTLLAVAGARAERPFITDDADVTGAGELELQAWGDTALGARGARPALFWNVAVGVLEPLELSGGAALGRDPSGRATVANPYAQAKLQLLGGAGLAPGLALAGQLTAPVGQGTLADERGRVSSYAALTWQLGGGARLHANVGVGVGAAPGGREPRVGPLWGVGLQLPLAPERLHLALEMVVPDPAEYRRQPALHVLYRGGLVVRAAEGVSLDLVVGAGPRDDLKLFGQRWSTWAQVGLQLETSLLP